MLAAAWAPYPSWLNPGDNAWQLTAATFVGLMSVPGLVVLYGGVMQKRWSVNSMMLTFSAFALVLVAWVLWAFDMGFGNPWHGLSSGGGSDLGHFFGSFVGQPGPVLDHAKEQGQATIPSITAGPPWHFPTLDARLLPVRLRRDHADPDARVGARPRSTSRRGCIFVPLWTTCIYVVNAFLIWGGGYWAAKGVWDFSGGYVIHLAAGVSGFVAAAVIGPRLARDREIDAPNNLLMVATGAGLLWLGWNGFNGGDPYYAGADAAAAVLNTNLATAIAFLVWVILDYLTGRKPSLIGSVNGMIVGLVAITPAAGFVNGYGAMAIGAIGACVVYFAYNYLSRVWPFRVVDDTLGVVYTHGFAGLAGGLLVGLFADSNMILYIGKKGTANISAVGGLHQLKMQFYAGLWVIVFSAIGTFILLKLVGLVVPLRMSEKDMETGDIAVHGHEVYPSDVPSLGYVGTMAVAAPPPTPAPAPAGS